MKNSPIQDRPAYISPRMVPAYYKHPDLMRVELAAKTFPVWPWLAEKFIVALRYLAGHITEFSVLGKKHDVDGNAQDKNDLHVSIIALLFFSMVFYKLGGIDTYLLPKLWACSVVVFACCLTRPILYCGVMLPIIFYLFWLSISVIFSHIPAFAILGQSNVHSSCLIAILITIMSFQIGHGSDKKELSKWFILGGMVCSVVCILQQFDLLIPFGSANGRSYGTLGSPVYSASIMAIALVLAYYHRMFLSIIILGFGIMTTGSRAGIVAALAGIAICNIRHWKILLLIGMLGLGYSCRQLSHDESDILRGYMAAASMGEFKRNILIGSGPEQFSYVFFKTKKTSPNPWLKKNVGNAHSHNSITESLASTGILGTLALGAVFLNIVIVLLATKNYMVLSALTAAAVYSMFQPTMISFKIPMALLVGSAFDGDAIDNNYRSIYLFVSFAIVIATSTMFFASRVTYAAIQFSELSSAGKMSWMMAPILENYLNIDGSDRSVPWNRK